MFKVHLYSNKSVLLLSLRDFKKKKSCFLVDRSRVLSNGLQSVIRRRFSVGRADLGHGTVTAASPPPACRALSRGVSPALLQSSRSPAKPAGEMLVTQHELWEAQAPLPQTTQRCVE